MKPDSVKPFSWPGAGNQLFSGDHTEGKPDSKDVASIPDAHFEPLVWLPKVEVKNLTLFYLDISGKISQCPDWFFYIEYNNSK